MEEQERGNTREGRVERHTRSERQSNRTRAAGESDEQAGRQGDREGVTPRRREEGITQHNLSTCTEILELL